MSAKTYDRKTAAFGGYLIQNVPADLDEETMDGWMNNPDAMKKFMAGLKPPETLPAKQPPLLSVIDCDVAPFTPSGWKVEEHKKGGQCKWDAAQVALYLSKFQKNGVIEGNKLRKELEGKPVLNACVLDYLLAHPHLIPEEWKGKAVFFWGTIYRYSVDDLCVRYLFWDGGRWHWSNGWLGSVWDGRSPAALRAS